MPSSTDPSPTQGRAALVELRRLAELLPALAEAEDLETIRSRLRHLAERTALAVSEIEGQDVFTSFPPELGETDAEILALVARMPPEAQPVLVKVLRELMVEYFEGFAGYYDPEPSDLNSVLPAIIELRSILLRGAGLLGPPLPSMGNGKADPSPAEFTQVLEELAAALEREHGVPREPRTPRSRGLVLPLQRPGEGEE